MPYCPQCRMEYRPGFSKCSDCEVDLVDKLPEGPDLSDMVEAGILHDPTMAKMAEEAFRNEGMNVALIGEGAQEDVLPGAVDPTHKVRILVMKADLPRAKELLDAFFKDKFFSEDAEFMECGSCGAAVDDTDKVCPACGESLEE